MLLLLLCLFNLLRFCGTTVWSWQLCKCLIRNFLDPELLQSDVSFKSTWERARVRYCFEKFQERYSLSISKCHFLFWWEQARLIRSDVISVCPSGPMWMRFASHWWSLMESFWVLLMRTSHDTGAPPCFICHKLLIDTCALLSCQFDPHPIVDASAMFKHVCGYIWK